MLASIEDLLRSLTNLLGKDVPFNFDEECLWAWEELKQRLVSAPIISALNLTRPFEIMYDASDYVIGAVLGHRIDNKQHMIYFANRTLNEAQLNCITTEKEFLAVVFALEKFRQYY